MADIFATAPPEWFTRIAQPVNGREIGSVVGTLASGAQIAARDDKPFMQGVAESRMNQRDPMWKLKELNLRSQINAHAASIASHIMADKIRQKTLDDEMADQLATTQLITTAGGDNDKMLQGLATLPLKSGRWQNNAAQMRLAIVALKSKDSWTKAISKLSPEGIASVMQYPEGSPQGWQEIAAQGAKMVESESTLKPMQMGKETVWLFKPRKGSERIIHEAGMSPVAKAKFQSALRRRDAATKALMQPMTALVPSARAAALKEREDAEADLESLEDSGETPSAAPSTATGTTPPAGAATVKFPTRAVAREYVTKFGAKAAEELKKAGFDTTGYAD